MEDTTSWHWTSGQPRLNPQYCTQAPSSQPHTSACNSCRRLAHRHSLATQDTDEPSVHSHRVSDTQLGVRPGMVCGTGALACGADGRGGRTWTA